jgi:hypothetical protein
MRLVHELDCPNYESITKLDPMCPALWRYRKKITIENVSFKFQEYAQGCDKPERCEILAEFLKKVCEQITQDVWGKITFHVNCSNSRNNNFACKTYFSYVHERPNFICTNFEFYIREYEMHILDVKCSYSQRIFYMWHNMWNIGKERPPLSAKFSIVVYQTIMKAPWACPFVNILYVLEDVSYH